MSGPRRGADFPATVACWRRCLSFLLPLDCIAACSCKLLEKYIIARYCEPQRHYHTLTHVEEMLNGLALFQANAPPAHVFLAADTRRLVLELALLFHDAVYNPRSGDNEEASAAWFVAFWEEARLLAGERAAGDDQLLWDDTCAAAAVKDDVVDFIMRTKNHMAVEPCYVQGANAEDTSPPPPPPALHIFLDLDLAILGSDVDRYKQYAADIRREYYWYTETDFCRGRSIFLRSLLAHPQLYKTKFFCDLLEETARANVLAEAVMLEKRLKEENFEGPN